MWITSDRYNEIAYHSQSRDGAKVIGYIYYKIGNDWQRIEFGNSDIKIGSLTISKKTSDGNSSNVLGFGGVYSAEMRIALKRKTDRYELTNEIMQNAKIFMKYQIEEGDTPTVPLGWFSITESKREDEFLSLRGYDFLIEKTKQSIDVLVPKGHIYYSTFSNWYAHIVNHTCIPQLCGFDGEIQQNTDHLDKYRYIWTEKLKKITPHYIFNGQEYEYMFAIDNRKRNNLTLRDVLHSMGLVIGCFFQMGESGLLLAEDYHELIGTPEKPHSPDEFEISKEIRKRGVVYDKLYNFQTVKFNANGKDFKIGPDDPEKFDVYDIGNFPLLLAKPSEHGYITDEDYNNIAEHLLNVVRKYIFHPCNIEFIGNPAIQLGDVFPIAGSGDIERTNMFVMNSQWTFHGLHKLSSHGGDNFLRNLDLEKQKKEEQETNDIIDNRLVKYQYTENRQNILLPADGSEALLCSVKIETGNLPESDIFIQGTLSLKVGTEPSYIYVKYRADGALRGQQILYANNVSEMTLPLLQPFLGVSGNRTSTYSISISLNGERTGYSVIPYGARILFSGTNLLHMSEVGQAVSEPISTMALDDSNEYGYSEPMELEDANNGAKQ